MLTGGSADGIIFEWILHEYSNTLEGIDMKDAMKILRNKAGFTIIELVMVTVILAIGAAVTTWSINLILPDLRLKAAVRDLKSDMNLARLRAVRENQVVTVLFDMANDSYTVFLDDGSGGATKAGDGKQDGTEPTIKTVSLPRNVMWLNVSFSGHLYLRFNGLGRADDWGHAWVVNGKPA